MFGKREEPKKRRTPRENLAQFGFMDMNFDPSMDMDQGGSDDDGDLEAELLALTSEESSSKPRKPKPKPIPQLDLDKMVSDSLKDDDDSDGESVDENDPDLLSELNDLTGGADEEMEQPSDTSTHIKDHIDNGSVLRILEERLKMYQTAEANAKSGGETSRARRFTRGVKTLSDQIKAVRSGRAVKEEDIPPPVSTRVAGDTAASTSTPDSAASEPSPPEEAASTPVRPAPPPPVPPRSPPRAPDNGTTNSTPAPLISEKTATDTSGGSSLTYDPVVVAKLEERRGQYRQAAVAAKRAGNKDRALQYAHIVKQFDIVIEGVKGGEYADLSEMPPPPEETDIGRVAGPAHAPEDTPKEDEHAQHASENSPSTEQGPPIPTTVLEALTQRLELYQKQEAAAKADGNGSKARRMGRIVKQYQDAIKAHNAGQTISAEDLPTPPGYPPIPVPGGTTTEAPEPSPAAPKAGTPPAPPRRSSAGSVASSGKSESPSQKNVRKSPSSRLEKQMGLLMARQKAFRVAALQAKSRGEVNQAKDYLRLSKGFDKLIEATQAGLPVDFDSLPVPPDSKVELETDFDIVSHDECIPGTDDEIYDKLLKDLLNQIQTCMTTRDHFKAVGDVASANRFENMAVHFKKDLDTIKHAIKRKDPVPKFHYETRVFSILQCCTDLMDNDLEFTIIQGINYNVPNPKDVDTYVRFELPWPSAEEPQRDRTALIRDTNNPQYNAKFTLQIQRNIRACQRLFKRHGIKCEIWSRGGFLRSDTLIGTATVKLQPLETQCILHDSFHLMDGRKTVGGLLEVKVRVRNPIVAQQVEQVTEKWLVLDH